MGGKKSYLTVTDQFCGAGGSSIGAVAAGAELHVALNHWQLAIETHSTNFPDAMHDCTDISACDPRRYPATDILITSPECFPAGTLILTERGLLPIEAVEVGHRVLTYKNRWRPVTAIWHTERETVVVRGHGHRGLEVSGDHPFYTRHQSQQWDNTKRDYDRRILSSATWTKAKDLMLAPCRWASPSSIPALPVPNVEGDNARRIDFSPAFWWMVGRWLGDGSVRLRNGYSSEITICCGKSEVDELAALHFAPRQGAHARQGELHWRQREIRTSCLFECTHDSLARWLVEHFGKRAHGKRLPAWVFGMDKEWREALLAGYVSADGTITARTTAVSSVSKQLALGIRLLVTGLGYHPSFGCHRRAAGSIEGRPIAAYDIWTVRWENNKSQRTGVNDGLHSWTLVKEVRPSHRHLVVYNLSVAEDDSYVADGIVVHNCTNHSLANGKRRVVQPDLFGHVTVDPAAERSRATMWDVPRFAEFHRYELIIVENVVDARRWITWDAWLHAMRLLGYEHQIVYFNSMFAWPTPQSRDRMYVVFWRKGNRAPDLDLRPLAWCGKCGADVPAVQSWKNGRRWGRYGDQYVYCCPTCTGEVNPYYYAALNAIDWSLPCPRIGDRPRPLKEKTLRRIEAGLRRFGSQPLLVGNYSPGWTRPVSDPTGTITTSDHHGLLVQLSYGDGDRVRSVLDAIQTQTTRQDTGLVVPPFLAKLYGQSTVEALDEPLGTQTANIHHGLVAPPFLVDLCGQNAPKDRDQPRSADSAAGNHHALILPYYSHGHGTPTTAALPTVTTVDRHALVVPPFIVGYYTRPSGLGAAVSGIDEALPTQSTQLRHYLVQPSEIPAVEDCGFRMLQPHEIHRAMAFPDDYVVLGNQRDKVRQLGNAVTPPVMRMLLERSIATLR